MGMGMEVDCVVDGGTIDSFDVDDKRDGERDLGGLVGFIIPRSSFASDSPVRFPSPSPSSELSFLANESIFSSSRDSMCVDEVMMVV